MELSTKQKNILETWNKEDVNILIKASAGCSKTTTLMLLMKESKKKTLFIAFNKSIQTEIQDKIDNGGYNHAKAVTMHSMGFLAIRNSGKYSRVNVKKNKNWDLIKILEKDQKEYYKKMTFKEKLKYNYSLMDCLDISRMFLTDNLDNIAKHLEEIGKNTDSFYDNYVFRRLWDVLKDLRDNSYIGKNINIDYIDMIYLPVKENMDLPLKPVYVFVDECQDLNLAQHKLFDNLISQENVTKWVAVGDKNQSIYSFGGASSSSFDLFSQKDNVKELELNICYRCSRSIIDKANEVYDCMEYFKEDEGIVEELEEDDIDSIKDDSMVICRNTEPLVSLYFKLVSKNRNCYILGLEIYYELCKYLKSYNNKNVSETVDELTQELARLRVSENVKDKMKLSYKKEQYSNFTQVVNNFNGYGETVKSLLNRIKPMFEPKEGAIKLCTIHKSKGLESKVVYIINESLIPSKFATTEEQLIQEENLRYVARTRAKDELYFLDFEMKKK